MVHVLRHAAYAAVFCIGLVLAACSPEAPAESAGSNAPSPSSSDLADDLTRVEVAGEGFSIGLPAGWDEISAEDLGESGVMEGLASANPETAGVIDQAQAAIESGQIAFFAFDTEPTDQTSTFAANVNVINAGDVEGSASDAAEEMATTIESQIPVNGEVTTDTITLPAGDAAVVRYEWTIVAADGTSNDAAVTQYAVLADGRGYILSFTSLADEATEYDPIFTTMAESFQAE